MKNKFIDTKQYWEQRYQESLTGWYIGYASPPLITYAMTNIPKNAALFIPGYGYGHEVKK